MKSEVGTLAALHEHELGSFCRREKWLDAWSVRNPLVQIGLKPNEAETLRKHHVADAWRGEGCRKLLGCWLQTQTKTSYMCTRGRVVYKPKLN